MLCITYNIRHSELVSESTVIHADADPPAGGQHDYMMKQR